MRKADIYQKIYWGDILKRTMHLHGYERGPYLMLIACYFLRGGPLPDDDARFATITALSLQQWRAMRPLLEPFFDIRGGLWRNEAVEEEIRTAEADWQAKSRGARITNARRTAQRPAERPAQRPQSESVPEAPSTSKTIGVSSLSHQMGEGQGEGTGVPNALDGLEEEQQCLRRTRELLGPAQTAGRRICFWRSLYRQCPPAYRDALAEAERKQDLPLGLPEAQIKEDWAFDLEWTFKRMKRAYAKPDNAEALGKNPEAGASGACS